MTAQASLIIHRAGGYADYLRRYKIVVNGIEVGRIRRNSTLQIDVPTGRIELEGRIDWTKSQPLLLFLQEGDVVEVDISNTYGALNAGWAIDAGRDHYLTLRLRP